MTVEEYNQSVDLYANNIYRFIVKNLRDNNFANDIVQDTFEKLWINLANVTGSKVKSYLFTVAYHTMINYVRKMRRLEYHDELPISSGYVEGGYDNLQEILHEAVNKLSPVQRSVIMLRDYEGYSYDEISEITGLNESQVKVYIYRARMYLKNYIGRLEMVI